MKHSENKILDWNKYESWVLENLGCSSLKANVDDSILKNLLKSSKQLHETDPRALISLYDVDNFELLMGRLVLDPYTD